MADFMTSYIVISDNYNRLSFKETPMEELNDPPHHHHVWQRGGGSMRVCKTISDNSVRHSFGDTLFLHEVYNKLKVVIFGRCY